jgi:hypothetical protein
MLPAMAEMEDMGIRRVVTHGEKAAAYMADGQATGRMPSSVASARPISSCLGLIIGRAGVGARSGRRHQAALASRKCSTLGVRLSIRRTRGCASENEH